MYRIITEPNESSNLLKNSILQKSWPKQYAPGTHAQILKKPLLAQKQTIPHIKAPSLSSLLTNGPGHGIITGVKGPLEELDVELEMYKEGGIMKIKRLAFNDTLEEFYINLDGKRIMARGCR